MHAKCEIKKSLFPSLLEDNNQEFLYIIFCDFLIGKKGDLNPIWRANKKKNLHDGNEPKWGSEKVYV